MNSPTKQQPIKLKIKLLQAVSHFTGEFPDKATTNQIKDKATAGATGLPTAWCLLLIITPDRRQSETLLTIDEHRSKIARISVLDCHLSPVSKYFFYLHLSIVLTFLIAACPV